MRLMFYRFYIYSIKLGGFLSTKGSINAKDPDWSFTLSQGKLPFSLKSTDALSIRISLAKTNNFQNCKIRLLSSALAFYKTSVFCGEDKVVYPFSHSEAKGITPSLSFCPYWQAKDWMSTSKGFPISCFFNIWMGIVFLAHWHGLAVCLNLPWMRT